MLDSWVWAGKWKPALASAISIVILSAFGGLFLHAVGMVNWGRSHPPDRLPPPVAGYFKLLQVGSYSSLPGDAAAAAEVHRSPWEPRPDNTRYNHTLPSALRLLRVNVATHAYDPRWNKYILGRITGNFTGTTDEIFQWAAAKWGIPDNLLRTVAYMESDWRQSNYGDFTHDRAECPRGYWTLPCPVTFGIVGTKSTSWRGIFPWNRDSTAAAVDVVGGWLRGCYEGWVWWLRDHGNRSRGVYHAGDIWGCVGAWYSGDWHDGSISTAHSGENYIYRARHWYKVRPWRRTGF
jgi:autotransporter family porin